MCPIAVAACPRPRRAPAWLRAAGMPLSLVLRLPILRPDLRAILACLLAAICWGAQAHDLAAHVAIAIAPPALAGGASVSDSIVTITNTSPYPIAAPFTLTVGRLAAPGVAVTHPARVRRNLEVDIDVALPRGILPPGAEIAVPVRFANPRRLPFTYDVTATGTLLTPENSVALTVTAWRYSGDGASPRGEPAGPGVGIVVDGVVRALTDADSQATVLVPLTQQAVAARLAPTGTGIAHLSLAAGSANSADIVLGDDGEVYGEATFRFDETVQSIIPANTSKLTGRFIAPDGSTVRLTQLASVDAVHVRDGSRAMALTSSFAVNPDGTIRCTSPYLFIDMSARTMVEFVVTGFDAAGTAYRGRLAVQIGRMGARKGKLVPPPSDPGLDLGGVTVTALLSRRGIYSAILSTVTNADGSFTLPSLPFGDLEVSADVQRDGRHYMAAASNGEYDTLPLSLALTSGSDVQRAPWHAAADPALPEVRVDIDSAISEEMSRSATLLVGQGTARLTLGYMAWIDRFGEQQTDAWGVRVLAGAAGKPLFVLHRQVGAQFFDLLQSASRPTTVWIEQQIDVAELTRDGDAEVTLQAYGVIDNLRYRHLGVAAALRTGAALTIESLALAGVPPAGTAANREVSLPDPGASNLFQRRLRVVTGLPAGATITNVKVQLDWQDGWEPVTVLDTPPGPGVLVDGDVIDTFVTYRAETDQDLRSYRSTMPTQYRVTVTALAADGTTLAAEGYDTVKWPLRRAPALARSGTPAATTGPPTACCAGSTSMPACWAPSPTCPANMARTWGTPGTPAGTNSTWTISTASPVPKPAAARRTTASCSPASATCRGSAANPVEVAAGKAAAAEVKAWILASRAGIERLSRAGVGWVSYMLGGPDSAGIAGADWGARLLTTGRVTVGGTQFDLGTGNWSNYSYFPQVNHHHHVHVAIQPDFYW